jgi:hypothetical protein
MNSSTATGSRDITFAVSESARDVIAAFVDWLPHWARCSPFPRRNLSALSVTYLDARSYPYSSITVPQRPSTGPVAAWNVHGWWSVVHGRRSVVHRRRTSRRYPKKRAQCQSTKQGRYKIVPRCRWLRRDASKRYGNCTARNRNPLHVAPQKSPRNISIKI